MEHSMRQEDYFAKIKADASGLMDSCNDWMIRFPDWIHTYKTDTDTLVDTADTPGKVFDESFRTFDMWHPELNYTLSSNTFLKKLHKKFPIDNIAINNFHPNFYYRLHTDHGRGVTINMLIAGTDSHCLFVDDTHFIELDYKPGEMYLFNTQKPHTITNFSQQRTLFSIRFVDDKDTLSYDILYNYLKNNGLVD
jgi:hypothetical protein|tara:strand:- start:77 stop:658 length:582 start_codon:yes stop_codon:yes gene_type:complete